MATIGDVVQSWLVHFLPGTGAQIALFQDWESGTLPNWAFCVGLCSGIGAVEISQAGKEETAKGKKTAAQKFLSL